MTATSLPIPRPWTERAEELEALAAPAEAVADAEERAPALQAVGAALAGAVAHLGEQARACEKHGAYTSRGTRLGVGKPIEVWTTCPACAQAALQAERDAAREAEAARDAALRSARIEAALGRSAMPRRFIGRTFDTYVADGEPQQRALAAVRSFAERFERHAERGTTLILSGQPGTGKSHLACAALQAVMPRHVGLYVTMSGLIRLVRDTWRRDSDRTESEVMADLSCVDLLVVDEVGMQYGTDAEKTLFSEVMDRRYLDRRPSILLTNLGKTAFEECVGPRVYDRLNEVGRWVPFEWPSYRAIARKEIQ